MKRALQVIDLIPNVHCTPALAALRRAALDGRPATLRLSDEDHELAFHDAHVQLTSPIGARILKMLHDGGHLKMKKPPVRSLPALDAYVFTETALRAESRRSSRPMPQTRASGRDHCRSRLRAAGGTDSLSGA